jgi:hypothetical protein
MNLNRELRGKNTGEMWTMFKETIHAAVERNVPLKKESGNRRAARMTGEIMRAIRKTKEEIVEDGEGRKSEEAHWKCEEKIYCKKLATGNDGNNRPF